MLNITNEQIKALMPGVSDANVDKYLPIFNARLESFGISTPLAIASFFTQIAHETGEWSIIRENMRYTSAARLIEIFPRFFSLKDMVKVKEYVGDAEKIGNLVYSNRYGNGDEHSGDGYRYRGFGCLQTTFKESHLAYIKHELDKNPETDLVEGQLFLTDEQCKNPNHWCGIGMWEWQYRGINKYAELVVGEDGKKLDAITRNRMVSVKVNGGTNGLMERQKYYLQAIKIFGVTS